MEILRNDELDAVSGGMMWLAALAVFTYLNLEKLNESFNGLVDGFNAGMNGTDADAGAVCSP